MTGAVPATGAADAAPASTVVTNASGVGTVLTGDPAPAPAPAAPVDPNTTGDPSPTPTAPPDPKPEGEPDPKPAEGEPEKAPEAPAGAPEAYEAFAVPDGMTLDAAALEAFAPVAKQLNLTQAQAQELVDVFAANVAAREAARVAEVTGWADAARADPEIGGAKFTEHLAAAQAALRQFQSPALVAMLNETGVGNHPEMIRLLAKVGRAIGEDKLVTGNAPARERTTAEVLYSAHYN